MSMVEIERKNRVVTVSGVVGTRTWRGREERMLGYLVEVLDGVSRS